MTESKFLQVRRLTKRFGDVTAVNAVDFDVEHGQTLCLLGPSGCGKTTILRSIAGLIRPDAGEITLAGKSIIEIPIHRRDIGLVFQTWALFPHMTARQNVAFGLRMRRIPEPQRSQRVREVLDMVGLARLEDRRPAELSGGQQQRVALARALVIEPRLLLFDEPLSSLDLKIRVQLRREIRRIQSALGFTAIYVTHDHSEALALGDQVAVMSHGSVVEFGPPEHIFASPRTRYVADFLGSTNVLDGKFDAGQFVLANGVTIPIASSHDDPEAVYGAIAVSPWDIQLMDEPTYRPDTHNATVLAVEYQAGRPLITLQVSNLGADLTAYGTQGMTIKAGDSLEIAIDWRRASLLQADDRETNRKHGDVDPRKEI